MVNDLSNSPAERSLAELSVGERGYVQGITAGEELSRRLLEIGFFPGAQVEVLAGMWPGNDPLAIRVGGSSFALRRQEAGLVKVICPSHCARHSERDGDD